MRVSIFATEFAIGVVLVTVASALVAAKSVPAQRDNAALQKVLVAKAKALVDAVATADKAVWSATLADDGLFVDEEAHVRSKKEVLAELRPLPPGFSGRIELADPKLARSGGVAVLTYDLLETENVHGQVIHARYHQTDVYRQVNAYRQATDDWRLLASQVTVLPAEASPLAPSAPLTDFIGTYALGPDSVQIAMSGETLCATRDGRSEALIALGGDHFARKGRPRAERIFIRDAAGHVVGFVDRRDNVDLRWARQ